MENPTKVRLEIVEKLKNEFGDCIIGMLLGGSMGFGQNFSVRDESDIDLVVVCDASKVDELISKPYFLGLTDPEVITLFKKKQVSLFWATKVVDGVEVNIFAYEPGAYREFCIMKKDLTVFIKKQPAPTQTGYAFDGSIVTYTREIKEFGNGFLFAKPVLINGKFWGNMPRQDFFYSNVIVVEKDGFFTKIETETWQTVVAQLMKEYGKEVDLEKYNVLNTHFTYQNAPERLPKGIVALIKQRTADELVKMQNMSI